MARQQGRDDLEQALDHKKEHENKLAKLQEFEPE